MSVTSVDHMTSPRGLVMSDGDKGSENKVLFPASILRGQYFIIDFLSSFDGFRLLDTFRNTVML